MSKMAIFIDGGYVYHILKDNFGIDDYSVDYEKFVKWISSDSKILRTYYYDCLPYQSPKPTKRESNFLSKKQKYFSYLERLPRFCVRQGKLVYRANDDISGIKKVEICITRGNDGYYWTGSAWSSSETWLNASGTSEWSYPWTPETDGVYTIKSRATDNADNTETPSSGITFTYDTTLPTLTNIKPSNNTETESGTITVSGETDGVNVTVNGEYADVKDGKFSATVKLGTGNNGRNVITINATDLAGNTNQTTIIIKRISGEWVPPATEWIALSAGVIVIALIISVFVLYKKKIIKLKLHKEKAETEKTGENVLHKEKMGTGKPKENVGFSFKEK
ncbi:MAG: hypothetical protein KJ886_01565 [Candidatus Thermoplasmatota archaeon]|nr:hypothetical protein [Candidatus Thermoplasmatota archaeon]